MTCSEIQAELSLYLYGELDFAAEESIELHLTDCAFCQLALNREKEWHAALNKQQRDVRPEWLSECRVSVMRQIADEPTTAAQAFHRFSSWWGGIFDIRITERSYRLAGISFLLLTGFCGGRVFNSIAYSSLPQTAFNSAGIMQPAVTRVREIRPESGNRVRILVQQVQVREVFGSRDSDGVRSLLLDAARDSQDPGVRMDSVAMLAGQSGVDIRNALVSTIKTDPNAAVRLKAVESLREFPGDEETRAALEFALAHDGDAGVREEAMDVLVPSQGDLHVTPQLIETMSNVMRSPQTDEYVRWRCAQILNQRSQNDTY